MKSRLINMLEMQDAMNAHVYSDWRQRDLAWYRAIWVECAELMDHYGWKWWKKQEPDHEQVVLELVDIWHFGLSIELSSGDSHEDCARRLQLGLNAEVDCVDFRDAIERFALKTLETEGFDIPGFSRLMSGVGLSFDKLYLHYMGKNVLNVFRQDNGYKEGKYKKMWSGGKEDNEHLAELLNEFSGDVSNLRSVLYEALADRYQEA